jgi:CubicO group peptidase (beta-lactamase class C family)
MLQGLGAKLGVRVPYLHIMACGCKRALLERPPPVAPALLLLPTPDGKGGRITTATATASTTSTTSTTSTSGNVSPTGGGPAPLSFLDQKVRALLQDLLAEGHGVGAQVVLYKNGRLLVNAAAGLRSRLDPGRVTPDTLFCGFSLTKCLLALLAHALVDDGRLSYDAPLAEVWPALKATGKGNVTLRHVLSHRAGLQYAWPEPQDASPQKLWELAAGEAAVLGATPVGVGGGGGEKGGSRSGSGNGCGSDKPSLHYYSFGWLLVPVLERAGGKPIGQLLRERLLTPLGLEASALVLGPVPGTEALASGDDARLATVEYDLRQMLAEAAGVDPLDPNLGMPGGGGMDGGEGEGEGGGGEGESALLGLVEGFVGDGVGMGQAERAAMRDMVGRRLKGREMLLDHRMLNARRLRETGALPSLSGRVTAKGLADVLEALCRVERSSGGVLASSEDKAAVNGHAGNGSNSGSSSGSNGGGRGGTKNGNKKAPAAAVASAFGINGSPRPVLSLARLQELRTNAMEEQPGLTRLVGREHPIMLGCGVQLFGFEQPPPPQGIPEARSASDLTAAGNGATAYATTSSSGGSSSSSTVRWGPAYGHAAACGQLALCDPSTGVVLVVTGNKAGIPGQKNVGYEVLKLVSEELHLGRPLPIW